MITATNKQCELERVKVFNFTRSLKLARVETLGSTRCSSYHNYYGPKVLEYFNSALNKLVLNFLEFHLVHHMQVLLLQCAFGFYRHRIPNNLILILHWFFLVGEIQWNDCKNIWNFWEGNRFGFVSITPSFKTDVNVDVCSSQSTVWYLRLPYVVFAKPTI